MSFVSDYMLSILLACLIVFVLILLKKRLDYFSSKGLPCIKPTWKSILRSFAFRSFSDFPYEVYNKVQDSHNSVIGYFYPFLTPCLLVLDPLIVQNIFIKDFSYFQNHGFDIDFSKDPLLEHLFNMKGDHWRALRNKLLPTFTSGKLKGMIPTMEKCSQSVIYDMIEDSSLRKDVNLKDLFKKYTVAVIASCAFGIEPESVKDPKCEFQEKLRKTMTPTFYVIFINVVFMLFSKVVKFFKIKLFPKDLEDFYLNLTKDTLEMRKKSGFKRNDFIQLLLELKEKGSVKVDQKDLEEDEKDKIKQIEQETTTVRLDITDELLAAQVFVFIIAGFDNSSYILSITSYLLSKNSVVQQMIREEVREAKNKHGALNYDALKDMKLLGASIDEALRMYPPIFTLPRKCNKTYTLSNGLKIEKGMQVMIPADALQNDTRYWTNPQQFKPERFFHDDIKPGTYMPFGDGPRLCIAQRLSLLMTKIMLAEIIDNFEILHSQLNQEPIKPIFIISADIEGGFWASFRSLNK